MADYQGRWIGLLFDLASIHPHHLNICVEAATFYSLNSWRAKMDDWYGKKAPDTVFSDAAYKKAFASGSLIGPEDGPGPSATVVWFRALGWMTFVGLGLGYWFVFKP